MKRNELSNVKWGEIYTCNLGQTKGSVQNGIRPVLVIQTNTLNKKSPTVVVAVITSVRKKESMFTHVPLDISCGITKPSMVMLEQMRTVDKAEELINYIGKLQDNKTISRIKKGIRYQFDLNPKNKLQKGIVLSLCPKCRAEFFNTPDRIVRRVDSYQYEKQPCDKCQTGFGYDYLITKRTRRKQNGRGAVDV